MLAALACIALQTSPLGAHPNIWEDKKYGIRMSYPREWHLAKPRNTADDELASANPNVVPIFAADFDIDAVTTRSFQINVYKKPSSALTDHLKQLPPTSDPHLLKKLPKGLGGHCVQLGSLRGYVGIGELELLVTILFVTDTFSFEFQSPNGDYIEVWCRTDGPDLKNSSGEAGRNMQNTLPTLEAMIRSIKFTKPSKG